MSLQKLMAVTMVQLIFIKGLVGCSWGFFPDKVELGTEYSPSNPEGNKYPSVPKIQDYIKRSKTDIRYTGSMNTFMNTMVSFKNKWVIMIPL